MKQSRIQPCGVHVFVILTTRVNATLSCVVAPIGSCCATMIVTEQGSTSTATLKRPMAVCLHLIDRHHVKVRRVHHVQRPRSIALPALSQNGRGWLGPSCDVGIVALNIIPIYVHELPFLVCTIPAQCWQTTTAAATSSLPSNTMECTHTRSSPLR